MKDEILFTLKISLRKIIEAHEKRKKRFREVKRDVESSRKREVDENEVKSENARCVSIGLVLALSNCSESGGDPDAMLDIHHPGTGIDSHHQQFHNSYGNIKTHHYYFY